MIKEIYINGQLADMGGEQVELYFDSPIFNDIANIKSNGSSTYNIPATQRNINIIGLSNLSDVVSGFPYKYHTFEEYRDGMPIIRNGICKFLEANNEQISLLALWGNMTNIVDILDKKLTELTGFDELFYGEGTTFLPADSSAGAGFLKADFGKGADDIQYINPCVNVSYLLSKIESNTGLKFEFPKNDKFINVFKSKWLPLIGRDGNKNESYSGNFKIEKKYDGFNEIEQPLNIKLTEDPYNWNVDGAVILHGIGTISMSVTFEIEILNLTETAIVELILKKIDFEDEGNLVDVKRVQSHASGNICRVYLSLEDYDYNNTSVKLYIKINNRNYDFNIRTGTGLLSVADKEIRWNRPFPIAANLPDIKIIDFLKAICQMYGLFAFYDYENPKTLLFVSIDDIYNKKEQAPDWTNKVISYNGINRTYKDFAQNNYFSYDSDEDVKTDASGIIVVDNETLDKEKEFIKLPFSATDNITDQNGNTYAKIEMFDKEGKLSKITPRILEQEIFIGVDDEERLKLVYFSSVLKFGGTEGLLQKYYSTYQAIIKNPVTLNVTVYLNPVEISRFSEVTPVYIDGVYYMPIKLTVKETGESTCDLIRMPPLEASQI